ncbi:hypothetical protein NQ314_016541 [Rhamnusium bicolor]|uniref:MADF domain-containing protein n=1 Tax=Rhamnusium bicolor TaxID=1586634 RepID=A0AAV8WYD2_9CUCU|nr:hypothetical protein NQ314_016541 [Rhamnusium bicolor]
MENVHDYVTEYIDIDESEVATDTEDISQEIIKCGDELLIDLVRSYPALYNKGLGDYKDKVMKNNALEEIGKILHMASAECQNRWLLLRQHFSKERLLKDEETRSGREALKRKQWELYESMRLLEKHILKRKSYGSAIDKMPTNARDQRNILQPIQQVTVTAGSCTTESIDIQEEISQLDPIEEEKQSSTSSSLEIENVKPISPQSCYFEVGRKNKKSKVDPVEMAFNRMNASIREITQIVAAPKLPEENDADECIGKLVTAELKKTTQPKKNILKQKLMSLLYSWDTT